MPAIDDSLQKGSRRRFNSSERVALYLASDGKCSACGKALEGGWHADHIEPHSKGGETDVLNGQALCPECNRKKGALVGNWTIPKWLEPFEWQKGFRDKVMNSVLTGDRYGLIAVTPGGGKTLFALWVASLLRQQGYIEKIIIVVPSVDLKIQWRDVAKYFGIAINTKNVFPASDEDGIAITYQGLTPGTIPALRRVASKAIVVGDEIHRAGTESDQAIWGERYESAFDSAVYNLLMSGTPVRRPGAGKMPFVEYKGDPPTAVALDSYGYGAGLRDKCVREIIFPSYDTDVEWYDNKEQDRVQFNIRDDVSEVIASQRYRHSLTPSGYALRDVLTNANNRLTRLRKYQHSNAGGIIMCMHQDHARKVAKLIERISGENPSLVISDNEQASQDLKEYANSGRRWIVAVNKVSEGVNIPRLRVEVYATNVRDSESGFRQRVLRVGRYMPTRELPKDKNRRGYVYLLADNKLLSYAESMKLERQHALEVCEEDEDEKKTTCGPTDDKDRNGEPADATTSDADRWITVTPEDVLEPEHIAYAEELRRSEPAVAHLDEEDIFNVLKANAQRLNQEEPAYSDTDTVTTVLDDDPSLEEIKSDKKRELNRLVGIACRRNEIEFSHLQRDVNDHFGRRSRDDFTLDDVEQAIELIKKRYGVY